MAEPLLSAREKPLFHALCELIADAELTPTEERHVVTAFWAAIIRTQGDQHELDEATTIGLGNAMHEDATTLVGRLGSAGNA